MMEREIQKLELANGRVPFSEWKNSLLEKRMSRS